MNVDEILSDRNELIANLATMFVIGVLVGTSVFMVLDSADKTPETDIDLSQLNQEYRDNATCIPPYRDKACYPVQNGSENLSSNTSTVNTSNPA